MPYHILETTHLVATCYMLGIIWFVQIIQYPLMSFVPENTFGIFHETYVKRTGIVIAGPMFLEFTTGFILLFKQPTQSSAFYISFFLLSLIWVVTFSISVPCHDKLRQKFDAETHKKLVSTNWIRTILWTVRVLLLTLT